MIAAKRKLFFSFLFSHDNNHYNAAPDELGRTELPRSKKCHIT